MSSAPPPYPPTDGADSAKPSEHRGVLAGVSIGVVVLLFAVLFATSGHSRHSRHSGHTGASDSSAAAATSQTGSNGTRTVAVSLEMLRISPRSITVASGTHLVLEVTNRDGMRHDLALPGGKHTPLLSRGQHATLDAGVVTRSMTLRCTVPGHVAAGMTMNVSVDDSPAPPSTEPESRSAAAAFDPMARPASSDPYRDPRLAPVTGGTVHHITLRAQDKELTVAPGVRQLMWTYNGMVPGPTLHGKVGDVFDVTLVNDTTMSHSIDFHASEVAPDAVMRTIEPGP